MFGFAKRKMTHSLDWLYADLHSHLLPGIDDGAADIGITLELIRGFAQMGYQKIITTPHVLWEMYPNTSDIIIQKAEQVKEALLKEGIPMEFSAAAEYYMDDHFTEILNQKQPLLTIKDKLVLVEFSMVTAPLDLKETLFELQMQGYEPVIAHPERYIYLKGNKLFFEELCDIGCHFQLNLLSLTGYYGRSVQDLAEYLMRNDMYTFAGTDLHNEKHLQLLQRATADGVFTKLRNSCRLKNQDL